MKCAPFFEKFVFVAYICVTVLSGDECELFFVCHGLSVEQIGFFWLIMFFYNFHIWCEFGVCVRACMHACLS